MLDMAQVHHSQRTQRAGVCAVQKIEVSDGGMGLKEAEEHAVRKVGAEVLELRQRDVAQSGSVSEVGNNENQVRKVRQGRNRLPEGSRREGSEHGNIESVYKGTQRRIVGSEHEQSFQLLRGSNALASLGNVLDRTPESCIWDGRTWGGVARAIYKDSEPVQDYMRSSEDPHAEMLHASENACHGRLDRCREGREEAGQRRERGDAGSSTGETGRTGLPTSHPHAPRAPTLRRGRG